MATKFECERDGEVRSFETYAECHRFVMREGGRSRLWSYLGEAQRIYEQAVTDYKRIAHPSEPKATSDLRQRLASVDELARQWSARRA